MRVRVQTKRSPPEFMVSPWSAYVKVSGIILLPKTDPMSTGVNLATGGVAPSKSIPKTIIIIVAVVVCVIVLVGVVLVGIVCCFCCYRR